MTRSVFSFFFFSLLLLLAATASAGNGNVTSGLRYGGCAPGVTIGECIKAVTDEEEEGVEEVVRRILQQGRYLSYNTLGKQETCNGKIAGNCLGAVSKGATCTYYDRCKRST